jgi:hypothetical protein
VDTAAFPSSTTNPLDAPELAFGLPAGGSNAAWDYAPVTSGGRLAVENFIRDGFKKAYRARIDRCLPTLMALQRDGRLVAACGLNRAATDRLFLEIYLDAPIEQVLSRAARTSIPREAIVEVGNLTVARPGFARQLIAHLTAYLHAREPRWVVFSAVPQLRNNFVRLGIPLLRLAPADRERLPPATREDWGTYYDGAPQVTAVKVAAAHAALSGKSCTL